MRAEIAGIFNHTHVLRIRLYFLHNNYVTNTLRGGKAGGCAVTQLDEISINHQLTLRHSTRVQFQMRTPPNDHYNAVLIAKQLMKSPQVPAPDVRWLGEFS